MNSQCVSVMIKNIGNSSRENKITLPIFVYYQINRYYRVMLKAGDSEYQVTCSPNNTQNIIELPQFIMESFGLSSNRTVNLFVRNNKIFLGPLIGIFISNGQIKKANAQNPNFRFIETAKANSLSNSVVYYFTIKDVDFSQKKIIGTWFNNQTNQWEKKNYPYPDVLYDRGGGTLKSQQAISKYIRTELEKDRNLIKVNPTYFFDKWEVYSSMMRYEEMRMHLPRTILFNKKEDLIKMVERYSVIYIKDSLGNNGKGVAKVMSLPEGKYELSHFLGNTFKFVLDDLEGLLDKIKELFEDKRVILQSAIDLLQVNNRNIDMRATVQRNGNGELNITALPVRMGKEGCPITTTRSGSSVYKFEDFFGKYYNFSSYQINELRERVRYFLLRCFTTIEDIFGTCGEIGIDYAIDKNFKIWFIECNAKPGKDTLYLSYDDNTISRAFLNPLEYAKYLWRNFNSI
jgi:hypothetical protein